MPAGNADGVNHFGAQLIGQRAQFIRLKPPEIGRRDYAIEQRRDWTAFPACHQWISLFALPVLYATAIIRKGRRRKCAFVTGITCRSGSRRNGPAPRSPAAEA